MRTRTKKLPGAISQRLRQSHADLLALAAEAGLERRYDVVMANLNTATTALWLAVAEAEAAEPLESKQV